MFYPADKILEMCSSGNVHATDRLYLTSIIARRFPDEGERSLHGSLLAALLKRLPPPNELKKIVPRITEIVQTAGYVASAFFWWDINAIRENNFTFTLSDADRTRTAVLTWRHALKKPGSFFEAGSFSWVPDIARRRLGDAEALQLVVESPDYGSMKIMLASALTHGLDASIPSSRAYFERGLEPLQAAQ